MRKYTKMIAGVLFAFAIAFATSAFAADTVKAGAVAQTSAVQSTSLFNAGEVGVSLSTGYVLDRANLFKAPYSLNATAGAFWFPLRNLGVEANVPFYQSTGVSVDEVQAGLVLRLPLAKTTPLFRNVAPYVGFEGVYNWQDAVNWAYIAKAGVDVRLNAKWGLFVEGQYRNNELRNVTTTLDQGQTSVQGGLKLVF